MTPSKTTVQHVPIEALAEQEIRPAYTAYQRASAEQKARGKELGAILLKWHDEYKAQGQAGKGFKALLKYLNIPHATAYRLMRQTHNSVSHETKPFNLQRAVNRLAQWAQMLPDTIKDCPEEALKQLSAVQEKLNRLVDGIRADVDYKHRVENDRTKATTRQVNCKPAPRSRKPIRVNKRSPITQDKLDSASVGVVAEYSGDQRGFVFGHRVHRVVPESLATDLARLEARE